MNNGLLGREQQCCGYAVPGSSSPGDLWCSVPMVVAVMFCLHPAVGRCGGVALSKWS